MNLDINFLFTNYRELGKITSVYIRVGKGDSPQKMRIPHKFMNLPQISEEKKDS